MEATCSTDLTFDGKDMAAAALTMSDALTATTRAVDPIRSNAYLQTCERLDEQLAPLKVWPTLPDRTGRFSFTLLDRYSRILYRSPALRQVQFHDNDQLNGIIAAARSAAIQAHQGFPSWGALDVICPMHELPAADIPCASCRLLKCKN